MDFPQLNLALDEFVPFIPLFTGHTQTVLAHLVPSPLFTVKFISETLSLADGDELQLEYYDQSAGHTLLLFHGLGGDVTSDYMRRSSKIAYDLGWNVVRVNHRGVGPVRARRTYHSGRGEDAEAVIQWSRRKFSQSRQVAVGFSMSGSILLNLLTRRRGQEQPDFAVVVHAPLDLAKSAQLLSQGMSKIYDARFYLLLKKMIREREIELGSMPVMADTRYIDEMFTSRMNGFKDADDYYRRCSALEHLHRIETKTFVLSADDDPFIDVQDYHAGQWNKNIHLVLQKFGGHMGYFSKDSHPHYGRRWLDHYLLQVFRRIQLL